jgi:16S rRNA (guanine527-N7)-methyltransferase
MNTARIAELLKPFLGQASTPNPFHSEPGQKPGEEPAVLSPILLQHISTYIDILLRWNARINLTAIRDPEDIVARHFGESLFAARHLFPGGRLAVGGRAALQGRVSAQEKIGALAPEAKDNDQRPETNDRLTVADIGSGAGFPGLPLKLWAPHISLTLIESNHKKAAFLREVARALTLTDVNIQNARAESLPPATFSLVTLRAVEHFASVLPVAASLVAPAGRLALLVGAPQQDEARTILPHFTWLAPAAIPNSRSRVLLVGTKPEVFQD